MNKTKFLILSAFFLCAVNELNAQSFCSTPATTSNQIMNSSFNMKSLNNNSYCLKVYFHVIRRSNGTGGQTTASVNQAFNILNQDFSPHSISFNWDNQIDYIDNDNYYSGPTTAIFNVNNHQDGIDIYLFDDALSSGGRANGVGQSSEFWVSGSFWNPPFSSLITSHIISHEMGHVLFLWHTHHGTVNEGGTDTNQCPELVNGSNSQTCGDYVQDTPADPHQQFNVNPTNCEWRGSGFDANGDAYNPDENNVMAYTDISCMEYFTTGQGERMRNAISSLNYLQQTISNSCIVYELRPIDFLCFQNNETITVSNLESGITTSWSVSSNVTILSSSNNSITVRSISSNTSGNGWVKATLSNGTVLQEDFWVGRPKSYTRYPDPTICTNVFVQPNPYFLPISPGATTYALTSNSPHLDVDSFAVPNIAIFMGATSAGNYTITLTTSNPCGSSQATIYVTAEQCGSGGFEFRIYPNPTDTNLTIEKLESTEQRQSKSSNNQVDLLSPNSYQLCDFTSELILSGELKNSTNVDVSSLKQGIYILKIHINGNIETHQIIIK